MFAEENLLDNNKLFRDSKLSLSIINKNYIYVTIGPLISGSNVCNMMPAYLNTS